MATFLCIDIGKRALLYTQIDEAGKSTSVNSCPTPNSLSGLLSKLQELASERARVIKGVVIRMPGSLDMATGRMSEGDFLTYLTEMNMQQLISQRLPGIPVHIDYYGKQLVSEDYKLASLQKTLVNFLTTK